MVKNGSKIEVKMVKVAAEVMEVLMAFNQIATMVILGFFPYKIKRPISKNDFFFKIIVLPIKWR